eukprot:TRINITY_DN3591_c0_g1_i2.p1 TRINITY_DN3591_c0_g1~~TRINITY_DN3591_c0_g1_i2.p1  ORF type:complete len:191 (+),score=24.49 TRINITY_DN3591_c0_g1_i2:626-1198(+)
MSGNVTVKALVGVRYSDLTLPSDAEIKEAEREIKIARANSIVVLGESIQDNFGELYSNNYLSDIILFFSLSGEKIPAHSLILKMYSPYFVQLVESSRMEGETRVVTINDEPASFKCMLKFMYCGKWGKEQTLSEAQNLARKFGIVGDQGTLSFLFLSCFEAQNLVRKVGIVGIKVRFLFFFFLVLRHRIW